MVELHALDRLVGIVVAILADLRQQVAMGQAQLGDVDQVDHGQQLLGIARVMLGQALGALLDGVVAPVLRGDRLADGGQVAAVARGLELVRILAAPILVQLVFQAIGQARQALGLVAAAQAVVAVDRLHVLEQLVDQRLQLDLLPGGPAVVAEADPLAMVDRFLTLGRFRHLVDRLLSCRFLRHGLASRLAFTFNPSAHCTHVKHTPQALAPYYIHP